MGKQGRNRSLSVEESERTVEITTIHKAKGLEKRVVLIPWCSWQLDPKSGGNVTISSGPKRRATPGPSDASR